MPRVLNRLGLVVLFAALTGLVAAGDLQAQNKRQQIYQVFQKLVDANDFSKQRELVGQNKADSFSVFFDYEADLLKARLADETEKANKAYAYLEAMAGAYRLEFNEPILNDRLRWANSLQGEAAQGRVDAYNAYWNAAQSHAQGDNGSEEAYRAALESYSAALIGCAKIKDDYWAAKTAEYMCSIHNKFNEYFEAAYYTLWCKKFVIDGGYMARPEFAWMDGFLGELAEKRRVVMPELIDITIGDMEQAKAAHQKAVESASAIPAGGEGNSGGGTGEGPVIVAPKPSADTETWAEWSLGKAGQEKNAWTKLKLPYYNRIVSPQNNRKDPFIQIQTFDKDAEARDFGAFPGGKAEYDGNLNFKTDVDKEAKVKVKNKFGKVEMKVKYDDDRETKIAHMMMDYEADYLELFGVKFSASDAAKTMMLAWYGISTVSGKIEGHEVTIVDTNGNGVFRDTGEDSIIVGKGRDQRIEPLGRYVYLPEKDGWYPYEIKLNDKVGALVRTRPYKGALAPLTVKYTTGSGKMPTYLIARGTGEDVEFYFDLMKGLDPAKPIWVPQGRFEIYQGYFALGSGKKENFILIAKGTSKAFEVKAGELNVWELGGAGESGFRMLGNVTHAAGDKTELVCSGKDLKVIGNWGEQYFNFTGDRLEPTVTIKRDSAEGRKVAEEDMKLPGGDGLSMADLWYPADCTIKNVPSSADLFYQLNAKHPILGQITSDWYKVN